MNAAFKCSSMQINMADSVWLTQGRVSNTAVSINSRGRGL